MPGSINLDAYDDPIDLDALEGGYEDYMGPQEFFRSGGIPKAPIPYEPSEAALNPDDSSSMGQFSYADAVGAISRVGAIPIDYVARKVAGPGLDKQSAAEMWRSLARPDPTAPPSTEFESKVRLGAQDSAMQRGLRGFTTEAGAMALDWTNALPLNFGKFGVLFIPPMAQGFGDALGRAISAQESGDPRAAEIFGEAAAQGTMLGLLTAGGAKALSEGRVDQAIAEINARNKAMNRRIDAGAMDMLPQNLQADPLPGKPFGKYVEGQQNIEGVPVKKSPEQLPLEFPPVEVLSSEKPVGRKTPRQGVLEGFPVAGKLPKRVPRAKQMELDFVDLDAPSESGPVPPESARAGSPIDDVPGTDIDKMFDDFERRESGVDTGEAVATERILNMVKGAYQRVRDRMATVLDEPEVADLEPTIGPATGYRGKRAPAAGEASTGRIPLDIADLASQMNTPQGFARYLAYTVFEHEPSHSRGLHEFTDAEGNLQVGDTTVQLPETAIGHKMGQDVIRGGVSPEEGRFSVGQDILKHDPEVAQARREFTDNMIEQLTAENSKLWHDIKRSSPYERLLTELENAQKEADAAGAPRQVPEDISVRNAEQLARIDAGRTPEVAPPGTRSQVELIRRQRELLGDQPNPFAPPGQVTERPSLTSDQPVMGPGWDRVGKKMRIKTVYQGDTVHRPHPLSQVAKDAAEAAAKKTDTETPPEPTEMQGGLGLGKVDAETAGRLGTISLATKFSTTLHNLANLGVVLPTNVGTSAAVAAGSKLAQAYHHLTGNVKAAQRAGERASQYAAITARYPIAAIQSAASTMGELVAQLPGLKSLGESLKDRTHAPEMTQLEGILERSGSALQAQRLKNFSHPDITASKPHEKAMLLFNVLADRFAIHTVMDAYAAGLKKKYGVDTLTQLEEKYLHGSSAVRHGLERDFAIMGTNAARTAFNLATSTRRTSRGDRSPQRQLIDYLAKRPILKLMTMPFGNALFGNAIPGALELMPFLTKLSGRHKNSMEYSKVENTRANAISNVMATGKSYAAALKTKQVRALNKRLATLRNDGIYEPAELYGRMAIGPLMIAAAAAYRVSRGDDGTEWDELKDKEGFVTSVRASMGYFAPYVLLGDRLGHMVAKTGKHSIENLDSIGAEAKELLGAVTGSRAALVGPGFQALGTLVDPPETFDQAKQTWQRVVTDMQRSLGSMGWMGDVAREGYDLATGTDEMSKGVRTDLDFWSGFKASYPWSRKGLPPQQDWFSGKEQEGKFSWGQQWRKRGVLEEEYNRVKDLVKAREFLPSRTQDPEYDALVMKHFVRLRDTVGVDRILQEKMNTPREKAEFMRKWVGGLRDNAKELARQEYAAKHGQLPKGAEGEAEEKLRRKVGAPYPGPPGVRRMPTAPFVMDRVMGDTINLDLLSDEDEDQ